MSDFKLCTRPTSNTIPQGHRTVSPFYIDYGLFVEHTTFKTVMLFLRPLIFYILYFTCLLYSTECSTQRLQVPTENLIILREKTVYNKFQSLIYLNPLCPEQRAIEHDVVITGVN